MNKGKRLYCGPPGLHLVSIVRGRSAGALSEYFNGNSIYYTATCRTALKKACDLLGLEAGSRVLVPAYNCGSEIDVFIKANLEIVPYRIKADADIDLEDVIRKIDKNTRAVVTTHFFGFPVGIPGLKEICDEFELFLIEDCAHALFSRFGGKKLGSFGDIAVFSIPKTLGTPDGGSLVVNNSLLVDKQWHFRPVSIAKISLGLLPLLKTTALQTGNKVPFFINLVSRRFHISGKPPASMSVVKHQTRPNIPKDYYYTDKLTNRSMSWISRQMLRNVDIDGVVQRRRNNYLILDELFNGAGGIERLFQRLPQEVCPLYYPVKVEQRDAVVAALFDYGIRAISWWKGYHVDFPWLEFPEACHLKDSVLALPIHQDLSESQIRYIARSLFDVFSKL